MGWRIHRGFLQPESVIVIRNLLQRRSRPNSAIDAMIVGLGNPGKRYARTRHNIGFMVVDELVRRTEASAQRERFQATIFETRAGDQRLLLVKPLTMMNRSGQAVAQLVNWYKLDTSQMLIVHDDLDLPFGRLRLRAEGGAGGHNGIKSMIDQLGTQQFNRLRIGIGRPPAGSPVQYVLANFRLEESRELPKVIDAATSASLAWLYDGIEAASNTYNRGDLLDLGGV